MVRKQIYYLMFSAALCQMSCAGGAKPAHPSLVSHDRQVPPVQQTSSEMLRFKKSRRQDTDAVELAVSEAAAAPGVAKVATGAVQLASAQEPPPTAKPEKANSPEAKMKAALLRELLSKNAPEPPKQDPLPLPATVKTAEAENSDLPPLPPIGPRPSRADARVKNGSRILASAGTVVPPPAPPVIDQPAQTPGAEAPVADSEKDPDDRDAEELTPEAMAAESPIQLEAAPLEPTERSLPINLATALSLSDARPLIVAAAQAGAWVAEAKLERAKVLWVPEINFGVAYMRHDGFGPDFNQGHNNATYLPGLGGPLNQNLNWVYAGGSLYQIVAVTDAIFEPLAARQVLDAERWNIQTAKNDALLATSEAYFSVHQHRGIYAGALDVVDRGHKLVERITDLSRDLVPRVEVNRAKMIVADMEQRATSAREEWRVASANLTQVLRLDPSVVVNPLEHDHLQITLIEPDRPIDDLIAIGIANRPELASQKSMIQAAEVRIRREKSRPLLPIVLVTGFQSPAGMRMQGGYFGTGRGSNLNNWGPRNDVSLQLIWQLEGMGFGNLARIKEQRGNESEAIVRLFKLQDSIAADVTEVQARVQAASVRVVEAERSLREAITTYDGNYEGLRQTKRFGNVLVQVYRPQEVVKALQGLMKSYEEYFTTVADYNRAQFALFHALGYPAWDVAWNNPPGEILPVDTTRPFGLPPVDPGPPPATR